MELYDMELKDAAERIRAHGRDAEAFNFDMSYLPPDPDGGGMFTVRYEIKITHLKTTKSLMAVGGIGLRWVDYFEEALKAGYFDEVRR